MSNPGESTLTRLRHQAEKALERGGRPGSVVTILDRILELAEVGSEPAIFAHRHLAEIRLEHHPWRAALHLRQVISAHPLDDVNHALMGLCQALLGNYRAAVGSYRRALRTAPDTPWYHHNLGHLLDVALGQPRLALGPLRRAHQLEPEHDEIIASLAHCLARLDERAKAELLAAQAVALSPDNSDHRELLRWVREGDVEAGALLPDEPDEPPSVGAVRDRFEQLMSDAGFSEDERDCAHQLWSDFVAEREPRIQKPSAYASAVEYIISQLNGRRSSQAAVARRYGVASTTLASRHHDICGALTLILESNDARYRV